MRLFRTLAAQPPGCVPAPGKFRAQLCPKLGPAYIVLTPALDKIKFFFGHSGIPQRADPPKSGKSCRYPCVVAQHEERSLPRDLFILKKQ
jgi:hypothetical protein